MRDIEPYSNFDKQFFKDFFSSDFFPTLSNFKSISMKTDVKENEREYILTAEMPGFDKSEIDIEVNNDVLTIKGKRDEHYSEEREGYLRKERNYGSFKRSFRLDNIKDDNITASYENGILKLILPKTNMTTKHYKKIDIN